MLQYTQLSLGERVKIYDCQKRGMGVRQTACIVGRPPSTVSRELNRNNDRYGYLYPKEAHEATKQRKGRHGTKVERNPILKQYVITKLKAFWSPIAIAGRWSLEHPDQAITSESIYNFIYSDKGQELELWKFLPRKKKKRGFVSRQRKKIAIQNRVSIHHRPAHIELRNALGHFEADLFFNKGSMSSNTLNLIERKSRMVFLMKNDNKQSLPIIEKIKQKIHGKALSVTFDNGTEFTMHYNLNDQKIDTYFCDPGSPWQKGSVENANGILRRFIPFEDSSDLVTQEYLDYVAAVLNNTPRKILNFLTPNEVFNQCYNMN